MLGVSQKLVHERRLANKEGRLKLDKWLFFDDDIQGSYLPFKPSRSSCIYVYRRRDVTQSIVGYKFNKITDILSKFPMSTSTHSLQQLEDDLRAVMSKGFKEIDVALRGLATRVAKIEENVSTFVKVAPSTRYT